jgi:3-dehydroquinate synthase
MQKIRVELGDRSYNIAIDNNVLKDIGKTLEKFEFNGRIALVSNPTVYKLYGDVVSGSIKDSGFDLTEIIIPDGEEYKSLLWAENIYGELLKAKLDRKSVLIALGGGVIGDITGFAASTYMRGIDLIQIPTTLLAQVDSSVGGKTGVNHQLGKNMIGTFWQPRIVWIDTDTLLTLPRVEILAGLAEVIKYGIIWDEELFEFLDVNRDIVLKLDKNALTHIVRRSCEIKSEVVSKDERESGQRAILNFGHTIGHALETVTGYKKYLHGEAVAIGMHVEARLSHMLGFFDENQVQRIKALIESYGLPSELADGIDLNSILSSMELDKKAVAGELRFILPEKIGTVKIQSGVLPGEVKKALKSV